MQSTTASNTSFAENHTSMPPCTLLVQLTLTKLTRHQQPPAALKQQQDTP